MTAIQGKGGREGSQKRTQSKLRNKRPGGSSSTFLYRSINLTRTQCLLLIKCSKKQILWPLHTHTLRKQQVFTFTTWNTHICVWVFFDRVCVMAPPAGLESLMSPQIHKPTQERRVAPRNSTVQLSGWEIELLGHLPVLQSFSADESTSSDKLSRCHYYSLDI